LAKKVSGIEITPTSVRIVQLLASGSDFKVTSFEEIPLALKSAKEVLSTLWADNKLSDSAVCTGISAPKVFFRETTFPFDDRKKVFQSLPFTLSDTLPFPLEEAAYSCYPFITEAGKTSVKSLIVKKDTVKEVEQLFSPELLLSIITAENSAASLPFIADHDEIDRYLSIHITEEHSILSIIKKGTPLFTRTLTKGVNALLSELKAGSGLSEREASELLWTGSTSFEDEKIKSAEKSVKGFLNTFIRETELSIRSFGLSKKEISSLLLTGEGSQIKGIASYLEDKIGITVSSPKLMEGLSLDRKVRIDDLISKGTIALGYALLGTKSENINFISKKSWFMESNLYKSLYEKRKMLAIGSGILLLLYTVNLTISVTYHKNRYDSLSENVRTTFLKTLPGTKRVVNEEQQLKTALSELENKVALLSGGGNMKVVDMLREISTRVPESLSFRVTRMRIGDYEIKLEGETSGFESVEKIKSTLGKSPLFNTVEVGGAKASRLENIVEFQLNIKLAK